VVFEQIEFVSVILFSLEYVIRFCSCPCANFGAVRFVLRLDNIIDLLACLPFWITLIIQAVTKGEASGGLGFVRVIRLVRVFRVFKFGKYSAGIQMFAGALAKSTQPLSILIFLLVLTVIILSSIIYMAEGQIADSNSTAYDPQLLDMAGVSAQGQLYCFGTIPRSFWWAVVTMTTVGYGDCFPVSTPGKLLAMLTMLIGVLILALPITVVGSNFQKMVEMYEEETSMLHEFDKSEDGMIDEHELRAFLAAKRKDNALRKDVDLNPVRLMNKYDPQCNGTLSFQEFQALKRDVVDPSAADPQSNIRILLKRTAEQELSIKAVQAQLDRIEKLLSGYSSATNGGSTPVLSALSTRLVPPIEIAAALVPPVDSAAGADAPQ